VRSISEGIQQQRYKCLVESFRCLFEPGSHLPVPFERQAAELGLGRVAQYPYCGTSTDLPVPFERQAAELGLGRVAQYPYCGTSTDLPVPFERQAAELGLGRVAQYPYCGTSTDLPVPFERQAAELGLGQVAREDGFLEPEAQVDLVLGQVGLHLLF